MRDNTFPKRKGYRLKGYDYSSCGAYFITVCAEDKKAMFGNVVGAPIGRPFCELSAYGKFVDEAICNIEKKYTGIRVDKYVIMPDHIHLLLSILPDGSGRPMGAPTVSTVINQLKGWVSKKVGFSVWQKLYYDHIIRDQEDYDARWQYIDNNPAMWLEKHNTKE